MTMTEAERNELRETVTWVDFVAGKPGAGSVTARCKCCGVEQPFPLPMEVDRLLDLGDGILARHKDCEEVQIIDLITFCPQCRYLHIDEGEWAFRPHRTHRCGVCGHEWRPANVPTRGVFTLPEVDQ